MIAISVFATLSSSYAQDTIVRKNGKIERGRILQSANGEVKIQVQLGKSGTVEVKIPVKAIRQVIMKPPADVKKAQTAFLQKKYTEALIATDTIVNQYKGLPIAWARQSTAMLGSIYAALGEMDKAKSAYQDFQKIYPGASSLTTKVGLAQLDFLQKKNDAAKAKLQPVIAAALKTKNTPPDDAFAYSEAFVLMAQIQEAENDLPAALENYLRTVTLFPQSSAALALAQEKSSVLIKQGVIVP